MPESTCWWFWDEQLDEARQIAPNHFMGIGSTWKQFATADEILAHAVDLMGRGATCTTRCAPTTSD